MRKILGSTSKYTYYAEPTDPEDAIDKNPFASDRVWTLLLGNRDLCLDHNPIYVDGYAGLDNYLNSSVKFADCTSDGGHPSELDDLFTVCRDLGHSESYFDARLNEEFHKMNLIAIPVSIGHHDQYTAKLGIYSNFDIAPEGFAVTTKDRILKATDRKRMTVKLLESQEHDLASELNNFIDWCNGDTWYLAKAPNGHLNDVVSDCDGFTNTELGDKRHALKIAEKQLD